MCSPKPPGDITEVMSIFYIQFMTRSVTLQHDVNGCICSGVLPAVTQICNKWMRVWLQISHTDWHTPSGQYERAPDQLISEEGASLPLVIHSVRSSASLWNTRFTSSGRIDTSFVWISTKPLAVAWPHRREVKEVKVRSDTLKNRQWACSDSEHVPHAWVLESHKFQHSEQSMEDWVITLLSTSRAGTERIQSGKNISETRKQVCVRSVTERVHRTCLCLLSFTAFGNSFYLLEDRCRWRESTARGSNNQLSVYE